MAIEDLTYEEFVRAYEECEAEDNNNISLDMTLRKTKKGSKSTHLKYRERLLNERRCGYKQGIKPSDTYLKKHQSDVQTELAEQVRIYDGYWQEIDVQKSKALSDAIKNVEDLEQDLEKTQAALRAKCEELTAMDARIAIAEDNLVSAEKRAADAIFERNAAEEKRAHALREVDRYNLQLEKALEQKDHYQRELAAKSAECNHLRQTADEYRNAATAAAVEAKGKDETIEDLRTRERDALSRVNDANNATSTEREKATQLSIELAMARERIAFLEIKPKKTARQSPCQPTTQREKSNSSDDGCLPL